MIESTGTMIAAKNLLPGFKTGEGEILSITYPVALKGRSVNLHYEFFTDWVPANDMIKVVGLNLPAFNSY